MHHIEDQTMRRLLAALLFIAACEWAYATGSLVGSVACGVLAPIVVGLVFRPDLVHLIAASILARQLLDRAEAAGAPDVVIDCTGATPPHADIVEVIESWSSLPAEKR